MPEQFLHGIEVVNIDDGLRPITTPKSSVIGLVGTAPQADEAAFPLDTPVLIAGNQREAAKLGNTGTLPSAINGIFAQTGALVVVIRVEEGEDEAATLKNLLCVEYDDKGYQQGINALLAANSLVKVTPRILIAPGFSHKQEVATALVSIAERLRAVVIADGPNTSDSEAISYRQEFGSSRLYLADPWIKVFNASTGKAENQPASAHIAGLISKIDAEQGFWFSPSNHELLGLNGTARPIDFVLGDSNARANLLNEKEVATIIQQNGYRLWGNRTCSSDPKWAFLSVRRTADMINDALLESHLWAIDRNITKTYIEDVTEGVNSYLRQLTAQGAILGGQCWADPELNTPEQIQAGKITFDFDFTPPTPAEHITFRSHLVNDYFGAVFESS
jgi:phage tail sheath protein FI